MHEYITLMMCGWGLKYHLLLVIQLSGPSDEVNVYCCWHGDVCPLQINEVCAPTPSHGLYLRPHKAHEIGPLDLNKMLGQVPLRCIVH